MKPDPYLTLFTHNNLKWIKDSNTRPPTVQQENTGKKLLDVGLGNDLFRCDTKRTKATETKLSK